MTVRNITADDAALLRQLIDRHPFKPYRNHRFFSRGRQAAVLRAEVDRVLQTPGSVAIATGSGQQAEAIVTARPLAWDTRFFGVSMARVEHVLREERVHPSTLTCTLDAALARLRAQGLQHVSMKVDAADHHLIAAAEATGFRLMDAIVTYIAHPRRPPPRPARAVGSVRPFQPADTESILEVTREAYRGYHGRFQLDPHLPPEKSRAFYLEWAHECCKGTMADRVFVAEDAEGRVIGWASVKRAEPASTAGGATIAVGSLGACRADSPGAYATLICAAANENHAVGVLTEAMTQSSNFAMVRVLEAVGAQYARAEYTFHAWLE